MVERNPKRVIARVTPSWIMLWRRMGGIAEMRVTMFRGINGME